MRKNILFNAMQALPDSAGVGRYAFELGRALLRVRDDIYVLAPQCMAERFDCAERVIPIPAKIPSWRRILFEQLRLSSLCRDFRLLHNPDSAGPMFSQIPLVLTIHDLSFIKRPGTFTMAQTAWKRFATRRSAPRALRLICPSKSTADDVAECLRVPPEKLRVIHPGLALADEENMPPVLNGFSGPFVLGVGTLEPRKNFVRLIEAVARVNKSGAPLGLVIAGKPGWMFEEIMRAPEEHGIADRVIFAGYCNDAQLRWLYRRAVVLAYVSLYEGFGFPPIEAMALDLPVIASGVSSIPEVCGDAAHYVWPEATDEIAAAIIEIWENDRLRAKLIKAGHRRAQILNWTTTAEQVSALYDEILREGN